MAEPETPENKDDPAITPPKSNDDWKAKYEAEKKAHDVTTKQRNMYKNSTEELTAKVEEVGKQKDTIEGELTRAKTEAETTAKKLAATTKSTEILSKFKDETRELAGKLGLELSDAEDDDAVKEFEEKLNALDGKPATTTVDEGTPKPPAPPVGSDNQRLDDKPVAPVQTEEQKLAAEAEKLKDFKF